MVTNNSVDLTQKQADFSPTKRFFVDMLTRDIELSDAILDLLDNSLDGVARSQKKEPNLTNYRGYYVEIKFSKMSFEIKDNCGGIPTSAIDYAFKMGKPKGVQEEKLATVGVYGIGMKRSIFKMGKNCLISTHHEGDKPFKVLIDSVWIANDESWSIPIQTGISLDDSYGTTIVITELKENVSKTFALKQFETELINKIIFSYSYILEKGFTVKLNGQNIKHNPVSIRFEKNPESTSAIEPYIYTANIDGVEIDLIVGFNAPLSSEKDEEDEKYQPKYESKNAGWTIVCNDRIVVYKDKTELTGWGLEFARYHTQFIAISGIVYFRSNEPEKLPITTTKRGVDSSSHIFLAARKHIVEGTRLFIDYTNKWKGEELINQSNARLEKSESASPLEVINRYKQDRSANFVKVRNRDNESRFKPKLPVPDNLESRKRVSFLRSSVDIDSIIEYLGLHKDSTASQVGEECFEYVLREIK